MVDIEKSMTLYRNRDPGSFLPVLRGTLRRYSSSIPIDVDRGWYLLLHGALYSWRSPIPAVLRCMRLWRPNLFPLDATTHHFDTTSFRVISNPLVYRSTTISLAGYCPRNGIDIIYNVMGDGIDRKVLLSTTASWIESEWFKLKTSRLSAIINLFRQ